MGLLPNQFAFRASAGHNQKVTIAALILTFNRKELLTRCLDAVLQQTRPADRVFVLDNASTDGTPEFLAERGYLSNPAVEHVRLPTNTGGAGGFREGMRRLHQAGYDAIWLMDDDGYPSPECLEHLLAGRATLDVVGSAVLRIEDPTRLVWPLRKVHPNGHYRTLQATSDDYQDLVTQAPTGIYVGFACLFNGVLIDRRVLDRVGYVLADLRIWGDENEYLLRCKAAGFRVGTNVRALHFHPYDIRRTASKLRFYYMFRNVFYIHRRYSNLTHAPLLRSVYPIYIAFKLLRAIPSRSPAYVLTVVRGAWRAWRGELVPFEELAAS
jgi:rhamnopyranosyl-N-acetylglucosaminyl-diphospho-decaprenol beta-1,3/1,4-galactofuranosyltransferase